MKKGLIGLLSMLLVTVLMGCGGGAPAPEADSEAATEEGSGTLNTDALKEAVESEAAAEEVVEAVVETVVEATEEVATPAEEMKEEAAAPAAVDGLVGSKWVYDEISLEFKEGNKVFLKGGPLAALAPDGTEADYTLEGDKFTVSVLGQEYSGTYDGAKLIVEGTEAVMQ